MTTLINFKDILGGLSDYARRRVRRLAGLVLAGMLDGIVMALQEVLFPDLRMTVGEDIYQVLYLGIFAGLLAEIDVFSKKLRERGIFLPF